MPHRVLVVEDEQEIAMPLLHTLEREGYDVTRVTSGLEAIALVEGPEPVGPPVDVMVLAVGLPDVSGLEVCRRVRDGGYRGGIIIVSRRASEADRVVGLDVGADDYLPKPFGLAELLARVRAVLRRTAGSRPDVPADAIRVDVAAHRVYAGEEEIALTSREFDVLAVLAASRDLVVPRQRLMSQVWREDWYGSSKTLDVTVGRLRHKLAEAGVTDRVVAVRGIGFRLQSGQ